MNRSISLKSRPVGAPKDSDFEFRNESMPEAGEGQMLLQTLYVSVDPYLRGRMSDAKSYVPPFALGAPVSSGIIARVITSHHPGFREGDHVSGILEWKKYQLSDGAGLLKVDPNQAPLSAYLGILGLTGLTAYLGLTQIGKPKSGETLVVSGAAGAVGSVVGQIGKIMGLTVVGIAGSDEKCRLLTESLGFDKAINYKTTPDLTKALQEACPKGIDVYFDNVGGTVSDSVLYHINYQARMVICGAISVYNETSLPMGPRVQTFLVRKSALMQGFIITDFSAHFPEAIGQLATWLKEGKLQYRETIRHGFDQIPHAFMELFEGANTGKMIVDVQDSGH